MERRGAGETESGRHAAVDRYHRGASFRRFGHDLHLGRLPVEVLSRIHEAGRGEQLRQLAGRRGWQRQRRGVGPRPADARIDWLRRTDLRAADKDQLRPGDEHGGRAREGLSAVGDGGSGGRGGEDAGGLPNFDYQRPGKGRLPDRVVHVAADVRESKRQGASEGYGRLHEMGVERRPEVLCRSRLRSAARRRDQARTGGARANQDFVTLRSRDLGFRAGTGVFALALLLIVCAIGFELVRQSLASIQRFGLAFWRTELWDPVAGEFGALPFIWGTLYSSVVALMIATPIALGIAVFVSELCPAALRQPLVFLTELLAAIPSIVYGLWGIFVLVPAIRTVEVATPEALRQLPLFSGPPLGVGMLSAAVIL